MQKSFQKGVSLYLTIVIMAALLAIVLGLTGILVSQLKMVKGMEDSVIAFFAADTGNERGLKYLEECSSPCTPVPTATFDAFLDIDGIGETGGSGSGGNCPEQLVNFSGDACYIVSVYASSDCLITPPPDYYCIKSKGYYKKTIRAIETKN